MPASELSDCRCVPRTALSALPLTIARMMSSNVGCLLLARRVISLLYRIWTLSGPADIGKPAARGRLWVHGLTRHIVRSRGATIRDQAASDRARVCPGAACSGHAAGASSTRQRSPGLSIGRCWRTAAPLRASRPRPIARPCRSGADRPRRDRWSRGIRTRRVRVRVLGVLDRHGIADWRDLFIMATRCSTRPKDSASTTATSTVSAPRS